MNLDKIEKFWNKLAPRFDRASTHFGSPPAEQAKKYLKADDTVLDFGCATGTAACEIAPRVERVVGIDISSKMIAIAQDKAAGMRLGNVDFLHAEIFDESLQPGTFDVILAFNILHFFKDKTAVMHRVGELLKPGGKVIIAAEMVVFNMFVPLVWLGAVQLLKHFGAAVTAVCATPNVELVRSLGADRVVDYLTEDFTQTDERYDLVFDAVGKSSYGACKPLLKKGGAYVSTELGKHSENIWLALVTPLFGGKRVLFPIPTVSREEIEFLGTLAAAGRFKPVIDRTYPLSQIVEAHRYVDSGQKIGNVIIAIA